MLFIHQFPDWTHFRFDNKRVLDALGKTCFEEGRLAGLLTFVNSKDLETGVITDDIVANFAIDGYALDLDDVAKDLALRSQAHSVHIRNYLGAIENRANPLTPERLFGWHSALTGHKTPGYRETSYEVVSENMRFAGPGPERLQTEMGHFFDWFEKSPMDGTIKAAIAHFWFLTISPFREGNGRLIRTITALQLCRAQKTNHLPFSLNRQILENRDRYFRTLNKAQCGNGDLTDWILWFLSQIDSAIENRKKELQAGIRHATFMNKLTGTPTGEREQVLLEAALAGEIPREFTAKDVARVFGTSHDTALREIQSLIKKGIVKANPKGGRSQRYSLVE